MVPGSTLMYGSNFCIVTLRPRSTSSRPSDAAAMPFPREDTTPPVTKMYLVELGPVVIRPALDKRTSELPPAEDPLLCPPREVPARPAGSPQRSNRSTQPVVAPAVQLAQRRRAAAQPTG